MSIFMSDLMRSLSRVIGWVDPLLVTHQLRVAFIARQIAIEVGLSEEEQRLLLLGGMLHDLGKLSREEPLEETREEGAVLLPRHSRLGYLLLRGCQVFSEIALLVRHHHTPWEAMNDAGAPMQLRRLTNVLSLANQATTLIGREREILGQAGEICARLNDRAGRCFAPDLLQAFESAASREFFWFSLDPVSVKAVVQGALRRTDSVVSMKGMLEVSRMFSQIIDFRCRHTATHSSGVAGTAEALAGFCGFSEPGCRDVKIAGYLHDIGKLTVPTAILNKPEKLSGDEFNIIKQHPFRTYECLQGIRGLEEITLWAALHHERLDATGYPFRRQEGKLPLGARIVAVADVFTALAEDRPYRPGLKQETVMRILGEMVRERALDGEVVACLSAHCADINERRLMEQVRSASFYREYGAMVSREDSCAA